MLILPSFQALDEEMKYYCMVGSAGGCVYGYSSLEIWLQGCCGHEFRNLKILFMQDFQEQDAKTPVKDLFYSYTRVRKLVLADS